LKLELFLRNQYLSWSTTCRGQSPLPEHFSHVLQGVDQVLAGIEISAKRKYEKGKAHTGHAKLGAATAMPLMPLSSKGTDFGQWLG